MALELKVKEEDYPDPLADPRVGGDLLDMWSLYRQLSSTPYLLSELTFFDYLEGRDGLLFPDFFNAVRTFIRENSSNGINLEDGLDETFHTMQARWDVYGSFFEQHPELRYLGKLNFRGPQITEFEPHYPFLRSIPISQIWSLQHYYSLRGDLDIYVGLDHELSKNPSIGTFFERDEGSDFGEVFIYLRPYGEAGAEISPYLPLLKHGDLIGFGSLALARVDDEQFVAVTTLQTDLLRRDRVAGVRSDLPLSQFALPKIERNEGNKPIVPARLRKKYLSHYNWAHGIVGAVEDAALTLSKRFPLSGVIIPTLSSNDELEILSRSQYAGGLYDALPADRGYQQQEIKPVFPLTEKSGEGKWWVKSVEKLATHKSN